MGYSLKPCYRFPYNFTKTYLRPSHYIGWVRHIYQRARYGVSFADLWSLDSHLARVLITALPHYLNSNPNTYTINVLKEDRTQEGYWKGFWTEEEQAAAQARWDSMVTNIIVSLRQVYDDDADFGWDEEANERLNKALHDFADHFQAFWT